MPIVFREVCDNALERDSHHFPVIAHFYQSGLCGFSRRSLGITLRRLLYTP
jgi:hypothetical protein